MKRVVRHTQSDIVNEKYSKNKHFIELLPSTFFYGAIQKNKYNYINIKTTRPISLTFVSISFLSILVCSFLLFCILSNKLNSISCGIWLSFKSTHLELFCKINIQVSSKGYGQECFLPRVWSRGPPCNFTEQLFFLHSCAWLLPII